MKYPQIIVVDPRRSNIHIKNILEWTKDSPQVKSNFDGVSFDELVSQMGDIRDKLVKFWKANEGEIMATIPKLSGFEWDINNAPVILVYPIPFFNSFSHPLLLKICSVRDGQVFERPTGLNLGMLIHELIHNNMKGLPIDRQQNETLINFMTSKILEGLSSKFAKEYAAFYELIKQPLDFSSVPADIKGELLTVKEFYSSGKK